MKTLLSMILLGSTLAFAEEASDTSKKKNQMDYGDKQLFSRDICRKPIEWLATRYPDYKKEDLQKMKDKCAY